MLVQAAGLAVLAAVSSTALLLAAVYLGSARPRTTLLLYLAGAVLMSVVMSVVVLAAPEPTTRRLAAFNGWLRRHGPAILSGALVAAGAILTVNGITGLIQKG